MNDNGKISAALDQLLAGCPHSQSRAATLGATLAIVASRLRAESPAVAEKALSALAQPCVCLASDLREIGK